jgi:hypothetical protein
MSEQVEPLSTFRLQRGGWPEDGVHGQALS